MSRAYQPLKGDPASHYDAVVVGAGIGGLVCANLLAKDGLSVLLVEQHYVVGGYCSTFKRKGFTFDAATHFYPLVGNPDTITGRLLVDLGIPTGWVKMDPVDQFHFPDGTSFAVDADFDTYMAALKQEFPTESASLDRFFALVRQVYYLGLLAYFRERPMERLAAFENMTLRQALDDHFQDEKLKLLLAADCPHWGSAPNRTSFVFDSMLRLSYFLGNYYPVGGSQVFADDLAAAFCARGGVIMLRAMVEKIHVAGGRATGVGLEVGPARARRSLTVGADAVVYNGDILRACQTLLDPEVLPEGQIEELEGLTPTHPCYLAHIGLRETPAQLLEDVAGYYWNDWDSDRLAEGALRFKLFVPTLYEPEMAPPDCHVLIIQKVVRVDYPEVHDWEAHKQEIEDYVMTHLAEVIPRLDERLVVSSSASARTSWRYTFNHRGAMLGWEMSPEQLGEGRPDVRGPVDGLFYVGHWTRPGGGITPVIVSAMKVAALVAGRTGPVV